MNRCFLIGRVVRDPEAKEKYTRFTLAVDRRGEGADFPSCVAFGKTAEFVNKYIKKGVKIALEGHIQTGSYKKEEKTIYTTDVIADSIEFAESKKAENEEVWREIDNGQMELPFN